MHVHVVHDCSHCVGIRRLCWNPSKQWLNVGLLLCLCLSACLSVCVCLSVCLSVSVSCSLSAQDELPPSPNPGQEAKASCTCDLRTRHRTIVLEGCPQHRSRQSFQSPKNKQAKTKDRKGMEGMHGTQHGNGEHRSREDQRSGRAKLHARQRHGCGWNSKHQHHMRPSMK